MKLMLFCLFCFIAFFAFTSSFVAALDDDYMQEMSKPLLDMNFLPHSINCSVFDYGRRRLRIKECFPQFKGGEWIPPSCTNIYSGGVLLPAGSHCDSVNQRDYDCQKQKCPEEMAGGSRKNTVCCCTFSGCNFPASIYMD